MCAARRVEPFFLLDGRRVAFLLAAEQFQIGILRAELRQFVLGVEIMHRFVVAFAHLDQMPRQIAGLLLAMLDVIGEIAAVPFQGVGVFVERFEQFQNFRKLLLGKLLFVGKVFQPHFFRAEFEQDVVQLRVVINVFRVFCARSGKAAAARCKQSRF